MRQLSKILLGICLITIVGCEKKQEPQQQLPQVVKNTTGHEQWDTPVDYSSVNNWLALPSAITKDVDLIYFYPTCYTPTSESDPNLCSIDHAGMRSGAQNHIIQQASAFEQDCNIFAPFYKQVNGTYGLTLTQEQNDTLFQYAASKDASEALDYYFAHYNEGRPFILAGHSQGAETAMYLLANYFKSHPEYYSRMVVAYIIGYSITSDFLARYPHVKFATGKSDTGVVVSWNTEGPGNDGYHNAVLLPNAISINPLNWKLDATMAGVEENLGSLDGNNQLVAGYADAQLNVSRGVLVCTTVDPSQYAIAMTDIFGPQCYHGWDYGFYYANIRANAKERISAKMVNMLN